MPRGIPKAGHRVNRVYRPDLSEHFVLVHPRRQLGIIKFNKEKTRAQVCQYAFDADGDMTLGRTSWKDVGDFPKARPSSAKTE